MTSSMRLAMATTASLLLMGGAALAQDSCKAQATAKNLHGAAQTSFMTKCEKDAQAKCATDATAKGLHGAAQKSFTAKCVKDASGA